LALGSALCALLLGPVDVLLDATALAAGLAYNAKLKRTPVSWLPFAIAFPLLPMFGAAAVGKSIEPWLGVALAMQPAVLAIHLADSLPDLEADASAGAGGVAVTLGRPLTKWISVVGVAAAGFALGTWTHWHPVEVAASAAGAIVCAVVGGARPAVHRAAIVGGAALVGLGWVSAFAFASSLRPSLLS
jgi:4-hydroxybenzoate polyprenyltransferase